MKKTNQLVTVRSSWKSLEDADWRSSLLLLSSRRGCCSWGRLLLLLRLRCSHWRLRFLRCSLCNRRRRCCSLRLHDGRRRGLSLRWRVDLRVWKLRRRCGRSRTGRLLTLSRGDELPTRGCALRSRLFRVRGPRRGRRGRRAGRAEECATGARRPWPSVRGCAVARVVGG